MPFLTKRIVESGASSRPSIHSDEEETMKRIPQSTKSSNSPRPVADSHATDEYSSEQVNEAVERDPMQFDYIDEALEESIPASDPPASTPEARLGPPVMHGGESRT
jgi:hypothetical protein